MSFSDDFYSALSKELSKKETAQKKQSYSDIFFSEMSRISERNKQDTAPLSSSNWGSYLNATDYEKFSKQGAAIKNPSVREAEGWGTIFGKRLGAKEIGNIVTYSRDNYDELLELERESGNVKTSLGDTLYAQMTDDEVGIYNYLLAKEGKATAQEYLDDMTEVLNARKGGKLADAVTSKDNSISKALLLGTASISGGVEQAASGIRQLFSEERLPTSAGTFANQTIAQGLDGFGKILYQSGNTIGNMLPSMAVSTMNPTAGLLVTMGSSAGNSYAQALSEGYTKEQAAAYGVMVGTLEGLLSKALGSVPVAGKLQNALMQKVATISNGLLRGIAKYGVRLGGEIAEEELQLWLEPLAKAIATGEKYDAPTLEEMGETAIITAISTGVLTSSSDVLTGNVSTVDGLTANEAKVIEQEVKKQVAEKESNGKKLTSKEKADIREEVQRALEKGYISTDAIESTLGGDTYKAYKGTVDSENSLTQKLDSLADEFKALNQMKQGDMTGEQIDRREELRSQMADITKQLDGLRHSSNKDSLKTQLSDEVKKLLQSDRKGKGSMLLESYNEQVRRGEAFKADLSQYNESQRETVQKAVDSGILNNTNRTHEFVDMIAKISADKGVSFDFVNNGRLKESGFSLNGVTVNGFVTAQGSICLNINSTKALNAVVGHEITHVLEGTDLYAELQTALFKYAKSKGDYQSRYDSVTKLYESVEGANVDTELTADLIGDYLFTDADFIHSLAVNNRNVFQKIYDEIKYLCKVATAGSKEARELERIKKLFAQAYRTETKNTAQEDGVRYSIVALDNGSVYVDASRRVINGKTKAEQRKEISEFFGRLLEGNSSLDIQTIEGDVLTITKNETAKKARDDYKTVNRQQIKMSDDEFAVKLHIESHIDEIAEVSKPRGSQSDNKNHSFAKDGFTYRRAYFRDFDGQYYEVTLSIGNNGTVATVYNVGKIKESVSPSAKVIAVVGSKPLGEAPSNNKISPSAENVNTVSYLNEDTGARKAKQLDIILENNPANNTYSTWIRDVSDIKTFEETLQDSDWSGWEESGFDPDYTPDMVKEALSSGKITVYSSYPIEQGVFVTPSRMEAQSYSANGKVYSKTVDLKDVAWIDPTQGQYAKVLAETYRETKNTAQEDGVRYSITESFTDSYGNHYENAVLLDTDFFDGISPRNWGERLRDEVNKRAADNPFILPISDEGGDIVLLQFANPKDRITKDGASNHKVLDKLSSSSDNISKLAVIHIDEIVSVSEKNTPYFTNENNHQWLDQNGWLHRNANVINQKNGNIYNLTVDLAKTADGRTILYATDGKIKKVGNVQVNSLKIKGSGQNSNFNDSVSEKFENVNGGSSSNDIKTSLGEDHLAPVGNYSVYGKDIALETAAQEADEDIAPLQERYAAKTQQAIDGRLTPAPVVNWDDITSEADGQTEAEGAVEHKTTRKELHSGILESIKTKFSEKGFDFDEVLRKAKNLSTFSTVDNTPQRVMEKALGYKQGQILSDITVNQVAQNETEGIKWLNGKISEIKQISKQYGIKPGSKESAAAQMYAEGFYVDKNKAIIEYGDLELAKDFPNAKVRNNIKSLARDPRIRQIYDETLSAINESRTRNAYPEIPKLDNYFLHFRAMEDTFSRLGLPFNPNDIKAKDLPTDLNGVTADLKPGQPYFASSLHRTGKRTSFDLLGGLERYLTSAKNQIYHIDDIQTLRALRNYIADTYGQANGLEGLDVLSEEEAQERIEKVYGAHLSTFAKFLNEEANILAGKTALIDRGLEGIIGRRGITFLNTINGQVGSNMVGMNISSSLTNFLPIVQTFAKTNKFDFVKAFSQTVGSKVGAIFGRNDSFAQNSPVIIRRKGSDRFYRTPYQKVGDVGYILMSAVDNISTELIARTKFNELTRKGMSEQQAHFETDKWVSKLMGDRSLGQMPQLYNSKMLGLITKFQLEVRNQLDSLFYDTIQEVKESSENIENRLKRNAITAAKVASTFFQLAVAQHLFGKAFESVAGYNPAFDIIDVLVKTFGFDDEEESEDTALDNVEQGFLELLEDLPYTSTFTGGRIPIASALPIEELVTGVDEYGNKKPRLETLGEIAPYYILPGGYSQIKKTVQGLNMFNDEHPIAGSYTDSGNLRFPVEDTLLNRIQAGIFGQWASKNARDYFNNERSPLKEKQIQEFIDVDIPISDYWNYREGLAQQETIEDKFDYVASLDLPIDKKNILINNIVDRKDKVDMSNYDDCSSYEEFDYSIKNPVKYKLSQIITEDFKIFKKYTDKINSFTAKNENGETVSGLKKQRVQDYIFNELDIDYGAKCLMFKMQGYSVDDDMMNEIAQYLIDNEDISYDDKKAMLIELGYTIGSNGTISWEREDK